MQTARLKAESQGRKAKVNPKTRMAEMDGCWFEQNGDTSWYSEAYLV